MKFQTRPVVVGRHGLTPADNHTPAEVDAVQVLADSSSDEDVLAFLEQINVPFEVIANHALELHVDGGDIRVSPEDWIVASPDGQVTVVRPWLFPAMYERVDG